MSDIFVQVNDPEEMCVTIRVEASYSPDLLTDMINRAVCGYKTALSEYTAVVGVPSSDEDDGDE